MRDGQPQQSRASGLDRVPRGQFGDRGRVERAGFQHGAFGVALGELAEQLVVQRRVDHHHRQQVERERERVGTEAEAVGADPPVGERACHRRG